MNKKIRIYKTASYINLFSVLIFFGILLYELRLLYFIELNADDLLGLLLILLIFIIFAGNFYYALKLISHLKKKSNSTSINNRLRLSFFIFEILLGIIYTLFIFYTILKVRWSNIWPILTYDNLSRLIVLVCLFTGYFSSLCRIFLTKHILKKITLQDKEFIEQLGKNS
jgi:hypothetical protein